MLEHVEAVVVGQLHVEHDQIRLDAVEDPERIGHPRGVVHEAPLELERDSDRVTMGERVSLLSGGGRVDAPGRGLVGAKGG